MKIAGVGWILGVALASLLGATVTTATAGPSHHAQTWQAQAQPTLAKLIARFNYARAHMDTHALLEVDHAVDIYLQHAAESAGYAWAHQAYVGGKAHRAKRISWTEMNRQADRNAWWRHAGPSAQAERLVALGDAWRQSLWHYGDSDLADKHAVLSELRAFAQANGYTFDHARNGVPRPAGD